MTESKPSGAAAPFGTPRNGILSGRPASAFPFSVALCGLATFLIALFLIRSIPYLNLFFQPAHLALMAMLATALGIIIPEFSWKKAYFNKSTETWKEPSPSLSRTVTKLAGLLGSMFFIGFLYWLFPEYGTTFYKPYYRALSLIIVPWLIIAVPYIWFVDARMTKPEDGLWHTGRLLMLQRGNVDLFRVRQNLLSWLVRGFFLPLVFVYLCQSISKFMTANFDHMYGFKSFYVFFFDLFFLADVCFCACGYLLALRATNTHIRSVDQTVLGWIVTIICFEPFWSLISRQYLAYEASFWWGNWLQSSPVLYSIWGTAILAFSLIYLSSTVAFGLRYSNLTHRGILTGGPYRWSKHPAYISQNICWWLISVPFIVHGSVMESLRHTALLLLVNVLYYWRAKTEERHLLQDPVYAQYANWVETHGLFAVSKRWINTLVGNAGFCKRVDN